jgi:hypothetical protein
MANWSVMSNQSSGSVMSSQSSNAVIGTRTSGSRPGWVPALAVMAIGAVTYAGYRRERPAK